MKKNIFILAVSVWLAACGSEPQPPADSADNAAAEVQIRAALSELGGDITAVRASAWPGVYEVVINGRVLYTNADGSYFIAGDLYQTEGAVNLSDLQRDGIRKQVLASLAPEDAIVFPPEGETQHSVWVFTDVDCGYCQKFHSEIAQYNKLGIEVRYLAYPRAGQDSQTWNLTQSVWCAEDRQSAITSAKAGGSITAPEQCKSPAVSHGYEAGQAIGLRGTPMIIDSQGRTLGGYLAPAQLLQRLNSQG